MNSAAFTRWAYLGSQLRAQTVHPPVPCWPANKVERLVAAVHRVDREERKRLQELLQCTRELLLPFGEPLELNVGLNRWLSGTREESYSDWLQWFFGQLQPSEIRQVLRIPATDPVSSIIDSFPNEPVTARREVWVSQGHEDATGRLDLTLNIRQKGIIALEVKLGDEQTADTPKQEGYFTDLKKQGLPFYPVLLVTEAAQEEVYQFNVLQYDDFCLELRQFVVKNKDDARGYVFLSFVLALAAAFEMNLLGLNVTTRRPSLATIAYLSRFHGDASWTKAVRAVPC